MSEELSVDLCFEEQNRLSTIKWTFLVRSGYIDRLDLRYNDQPPDQGAEKCA